MVERDKRRPKEEIYQRYLNLFAKHLIELRKELGWNQSELAKRSSISSNMIWDIENCKKTTLDYTTVSLLADGLGLKGLQREEFFAYACLLTDEPQITNTEKELETITDFYAHIQYPAFVQDSLFDLHSENTYMTGIFGMELDALESYLFSSIGPNILRILFDPGFDAKTRWVGSETWHQYVCSLVYMFRVNSQKQIATNRYRAILDCLLGWESFCQIWNEVGASDYKAHFPIPVEFHPNANTRLRFILMDATVSRLPTMHLQMTCYVPADKPTQMAMDNLNAYYKSNNIEVEMIRFDWENAKMDIKPVTMFR